MKRCSGTLLLLASVAYGQQAYSPGVQAAVGTPSVILYGGSRKSTDLGKTWTPMYLNEPGTPQPTPLAIEVDPVNPDVLYVIATDGSVSV